MNVEHPVLPIKTGVNRMAYQSKVIIIGLQNFVNLHLEDLPRKEYVSSVPVLATQGILESKSSSFVEIQPVSSERTENSKPAAVLKTGNISIELYNDASESFLSMLIGVAQKC